VFDLTEVNTDSPNEQSINEPDTKELTFTKLFQHNIKNSRSVCNPRSFTRPRNLFQWVVIAETNEINATDDLPRNFGEAIIYWSKSSDDKTKWQIILLSARKSNLHRSTSLFTQHYCRTDISTHSINYLHFSSMMKFPPTAAICLVSNLMAKQQILH